MIYFNLNIRNPYWWNRFSNIKCWSGSFFLKNKYWELQIARVCELFRFEFEWSIRQDHAGVNLELALFGYGIMINIYDNRHWDYEENRWKIYDNA